MHADDTCISYRSDDIHQLKEAMNKDFTTFIEWLKGSKLSSNVAKTKSMAISTKRKEKSLIRNNEEFCLKIQEEPIDNALLNKYLGIQLDRNLDWKGHIKALSLKISRAIGLLKHTKRFILQDTLKTLYANIVEPHFRFCYSVWKVIVEQSKKTNCKRFKIERQGY